MSHSVQDSMETLAQELEETSRRQDGYLEAAADLTGLSLLTGNEINVETMDRPSLYRKTPDNLSHLETAGARVEYGDQEYEIDLFDLDPGDSSASYQVDVRRIEREKDDELLNGDGNALDLDAGGNRHNTEWKGVKSSTHIGSVYDEEIEEAAKKIYNHIRLDNLW